MCLLLEERPEVSKEMAVTALELLGASFANDNDNYDIGILPSTNFKLRYRYTTKH